MDLKKALDYRKRLAEFYELKEHHHIEKYSVYVSLAKICYDMEDYGRAVKFYQKALENVRKGKESDLEA